MTETASDELTRGRWSVAETGQWNRDNERGEKLANECVDYMIRHDNYLPLLSDVIHDMVDKGRFGGVEVGFMHQIAALAIRGARSLILKPTRKTRRAAG
jgi:hypothetical protein